MCDIWFWGLWEDVVFLLFLWVNLLFSYSDNFCNGDILSKIIRKYSYGLVK